MRALAGALLALLAVPALADFAAAPGASFDVQFQEPLALGRDVDAISLDPDGVTAADVAALTARGVAPICYVSVGTVEEWRDDAASFPPDLVGRAYDGWPGERFLDARRIEDLLALMAPRFARCAALGFVAIEADSIDLHHNETGFPIGAAEALAYARAVAGLAHGMGLAISQKNAPDLIPDLVGVMDFMVSENAVADGWHALAAPYLAAGKPVFAIEYAPDAAARRVICAQGGDLSITFKRRDLDAWRRDCGEVAER